MFGFQYKEKPLFALAPSSVFFPPTKLSLDSCLKMSILRKCRFGLRERMSSLIKHLTNFFAQLTLRWGKFQRNHSQVSRHKSQWGTGWRVPWPPALRSEVGEDRDTHRGSTPNTWLLRTSTWRELNVPYRLDATFFKLWTHWRQD